MRTILIAFIFLVNVAAAYCQAGNLDSTFSGDGKLITFIPGVIPKAMLVQPDGKIVVAGPADTPGPNNYGWFISRFNPDGTPDVSFGSSGTALYNSGFADATSLAIQPDGKILLVVNDYFESYILRYNTNGTVDPTFNSTFDNYTFQGFDIALQSDGKIIEVGDSFISSVGILTIARYNSSGSLDNSFGINGKVASSLPNSHCGTVALQNDQKVIASCTFYDTNSALALLRYNQEGIPDSSFGTNGVVKYYGEAGTPTVTIQPDGKILLSGSGYSLELIRYQQDGSIDSSFGINGVLHDAYFSGFSGRIALQPDGKIVAIGSTVNTSGSDFMLVRYNAEGERDSTFGTSGVVFTDFDSSNDKAWSVVVSQDGKIIVSGTSDGYWGRLDLARYLSGLNVGIIDFSATEIVPLIYPNPIQQTEVLEYALTSEEFISVLLYDVNGKMIKQFFDHEKRTAGSHEETLNMPSLMSGSYFLVINNGSGNVSVKMVKQ